ncbi:hypothetical protein [Roseateles sp.]|uniref:COG3904 family protein n=5 Tax=Pseudomonadota TaxID=1224 RepID=UPI0035A0EAE9
MNDARPPRPYVDPTQVDHDKPAPAPSPAPAAADWAQASHLPRRKPAARPRVPRPKTERGYLSSHWHGEQSLVRSYWVNNMLLATPLAMALTGLMSWISAKGESLQISAIVLLLGLPLLTSLDIWCVVGAWRSAVHHVRDGGSKLWSWLARLTLAAGALQLAVSILFGFLPSLGEYWQMARGIDPIGQVKLSVSADGHSLRLDGTIGMGDGQRLIDLLKSEAARDLRRIELTSPGGRVHEAEKMAAALKQRGTASRAVGTCASACTLVFLAGNPRQLTPGAQLGFHRASTGTYNPVFEELANQQLAATYRDLGLPQSMIDKTLRTPSHSIWFAPREDLLAHALIAPLPQTLAIALPPASSASLADFDDALRIHPVWGALEKRKEGTVNAVATRMFEARKAGAGDEDVQAAAWSPLAQQLPALIADSDPQMRRRYVQLVAEQLKALRLPPKPGQRPPCRDLLDGRLGTRQQLPLALQIRESQWLLEAASAAPPRWQPRPASPIEIEVLDRTVGSAAMGMLARLWADAPDAAPGPGAGCEPVIATLDRLQAQPLARRELVERLLFQSR